MITLGSHAESWIPYMRAGLLTLSNHAGDQADELAKDETNPNTYQLKLRDGGTIQIVIDPRHIELTHTDSAGDTLVYVRDETIALDAEDLSNVVINADWLDQIINRWIERAADYLNIDPTSSKTAHLDPFTDEDRSVILSVYKHMADYLARSGETQQLDIHLTLPTEYWTANIIATDREFTEFSIAVDPAFTEMLEDLPNACELITEEGQGIRLLIAPLYLKPIRIN